MGRQEAICSVEDQLCMVTVGNHANSEHNSGNSASYGQFEVSAAFMLNGCFHVGQCDMTGVLQ